MPFTEGFPFRRLGVDHFIHGVSRIWWQLDPAFQSVGTYQLQVGQDGVPTAADWHDVGSPAVDATLLEDDTRRLYGKRLHSFYRVKVTTPAGVVYVSQIVAANGQLTEADWLLAREIVRKERLRMSVIGRPGYLLRRIRYGQPNTANLDPLTGEVLNSRDKTDYGTGFKSGYCAPVPMQCWDLSPETINEVRNAATPPGQAREVEVKARVLGFPALNQEDVWVDASSDQRWFVHLIEHIAERRGVPLIMQVTLRLIPFSHVVYNVEVGGEPAERPGPELPLVGTGSVKVDHDFSGTDELAYQDAAGCGILGAVVLAFALATYEANHRTPSDAIASSSILANGRWAFAMQLDPGDYVLVFEKAGEYGPDAFDLTVA